MSARCYCCLFAP